MLRVVIIALGVICFAAQGGDAPRADLPEYTTPSREEVERQRDISQEALSEVNRLLEDRTFIKEVDGQRQSVAQKPSLVPGINVDRLLKGRSPENINLTKLIENSAPPSAPDTPARDRPLVLISLSMPDTEIRALLKELKKIGSGAALRGLVNNDFQETITRLRGIISDENEISGVSIDPTLFQRFAVEAVPTFILPLEPVPECNTKSCAVPRHVRATGSVSLSYFLDTVARTAQNDEEKNAALRWQEVLEQ